MRIRMWGREVLAAGIGISLAGLGVAATSGVHATAQEKTQQIARPAAADGVAVRFDHGGNVAQVPMQIINGEVFVPVRINDGKPLPFLVATGEKETRLTQRGADELGLVADTGAAGATPPVKNAVISLPGVEIKLGSLGVAPLENLTIEAGRAIGGILGEDVLQHFVVEIEFDRSAIHFHEPNSFQYKGKGFIAPMVIRDGIPFVQAKANITGDHTFQEQFEVETGSSPAVEFSRTFCGGNHMPPGRMKTISRNDATGHPIQVGRMSKLQFGGINFEEPIGVFPASGTGEDYHGSAGAIGEDIWQRFHVIFDFPHQRIILEGNARFRSDFEDDMSGIELHASGPAWKTFEVVSVIPHSPGDDAGLKKGDIIAGIDDQAAADMNIADVREMFRHPFYTFRLTVLRGDKTLEMKLKTRRVI